MFQLPWEICDTFQSCQKLSGMTLSVCTAVYNNPEIISQINLVAISNQWIGTAEINPFFSLAYDSVPTFYFTLILQLKTHFQTCLCATQKWTCDCRLSINLWHPNLSFGLTANLERALKAISFPFKARIYQFSGHVFLFHYTLFFLPIFCWFGWFFF